MYTSTTKSAISPLFSDKSVIKESTPPVVVVGLPRSGSSFLSSVLSNLGDWYVFDDLYLYKRVKGLGVEGALTPEQLKELIYHLGWTVRARIKHEKNFSKPQCTWEDVDRMVEAVTETFQGREVYWHELLEEWLLRLALHHGKKKWGYKTPQDFMHMDLLAELFPGIRFVFVMRDPRKMMTSMKYVWHQDGNPRQYHPIAYALYWKMAYEKVQQFIATKKAPVHIIKFEKLVENPNREAEKLAEFLGTNLLEEIAVRGSNSSFSSGKRKSITNTETWICQALSGKAMKEAGYNLETVSPRLQDIPDLLRVSGKFIIYQIERIFKQQDKRGSVYAYLKSLLAKN